MQNWYSREFMSSSQTAAKLVFNIENCVDMNRVINCRPTMPPDPQGRESYVYIMNGAAIRSVKDLTIDDLSPWNSKKCKSSTRFSSVQFDSQRNSLIFNRYIISDTSAGDYTPDCLFACYYCKHPVFDLVKKIFYACDGKRERCLPGTFVIFVYEFSKAERLYRTQRYNGSTYHSKSGLDSSFSASSSNNNLTPATSSSMQNINQHHNQIPTSTPPMNPIRHFLESNVPLKFENFTDWDEDKQSVFDLDALLAGGNGNGNLNTGTSTTCLEDILQSCTEAVQQQQQLGNNPNRVPIHNPIKEMIDSPMAGMPISGIGNMNSLLMDSNEIHARKRRKITFRALEQQPNMDGTLNNFGRNHSLNWGSFDDANQHNPSPLAPADRSPELSSINSDHVDGEIMPSTMDGIIAAAQQQPKQIRHVFTSEALLENFRQNCLCDGHLLSNQFESLDEQFLNASSEEERKVAIQKAEEQLEGNGGSLIVNSNFHLTPDLRAMFLWFRNPLFIDQQTGQPIVHPVAILLTNGQSETEYDRQFLLDELTERLKEDVKIGRICRSVIVCPSNEMEFDEPDSNSLDSELFAFPCVRLVTAQQSKRWLRQKFIQLSGEKEDDEIMNRVDSELFDDNIGILASLSFEQFVSRQRTVEKRWPNAFRSWFREKSGWIFERCSFGSRLKAGCNGAESDLSASLDQLKEEICQSFAATIQEDAQIKLDTATEALELICTEFLRKALNALLDPNEDEGHGGIIPAKRTSWIGKDKWEQLSVKEKREHLSPLGLSSLLNVADSLDPALFWGLNRVQRRELISRANSLTVVEVPTEGVAKDGNGEMEFIVLSKSDRMANFIQAGTENGANSGNDDSILYCQCQSTVKASLCEHILAAAMKYSNFAKKVPKLLASNRNRMPIGNKTNNTSSDTPPSLVPGLQLEGSQSVEIICCSSSNGSSH